jgi:imidazolonepropionase-like amidohydrolase
MKIFHALILACSLIYACTSKGHERPSDTGGQNGEVGSYGQTPKSSDLLLQNANLIDGNGTEIKEHVNILVSNGRIKKIYPFVKYKEFDNTKVMDLEGKYVIPGLIEAHSHLCKFPESDLTKALHFGITSIRDMAGDGSYLLEVKQAIEDGELLGPDLYFSAVMAGPNFIKTDVRARISTPSNYVLGKAPWMRLVSEGSNFEKVILEAKNCGATGLKLYADLSKETVKALSDEAHKQGLKVWVHAYIGPANVLEVAGSGIDVISHIPALLYPEDWNLERDGSLAFSEDQFSTKYFNEIIQTLRERQLMVDATLSIFKSACNNQPEKMNTIFKLTKLVYDAGIPLVAGTDNALILKRQGIPALFDEIETFVKQCGMSPQDAIKAATLNGAIAIGIEKTHGTIEVGKVANLLVLDKNPIENIENIQTVNMVIKNGKQITKEVNQ